MTMASDTYGSKHGQWKSIIDLISDQKFNFAALDRYPHTAELIECCDEALAQFADVDEMDRKTHAQLMGNAMELLKARYSVNAPPGWYPVMKELRGVAASPSSSPSGRTECDFSYQPEDILSDHWSPLHFFVEGLKPFEEILVNAAKARGCPRWFGDGAVFIDAVMADMKGKIPEALITVRNEMDRGSK